MAVYSLWGQGHGAKGLEQCYGTKAMGVMQLGALFKKYDLPQYAATLGPIVPSCLCSRLGHSER